MNYLPLVTLKQSGFLEAEEGLAAVFRPADDQVIDELDLVLAADEGEAAGDMVGVDPGRRRRRSRRTDGLRPDATALELKLL